MRYERFWNLGSGPAPESYIPDQDTQGSQGCYENGWRKGVGGEIGNLGVVVSVEAVGLERWPRLTSPMTIIMIPAHQVGLCK